LQCGGLADALQRLGRSEGAEGFDIAPVEGGAGADVFGEVVALFGGDLGEGGDVVGGAVTPGVIVDDHRLLEAREGWRGVLGRELHWRSVA
jgi:hypothetical protein